MGISKNLEWLWLNSGRRSLRSLLLGVLFLSFAFVAACSDDDDGGADALSDAGHETHVSVLDTGSDGDTCPGDVAGDVYDDGCVEGILLSRVDGVVHDEVGSPLAGVFAQPCLRDPAGELICVRPEETGDDGLFAQQVPLECWEGVAMRVVLPEAKRALMYCNVPLPEATTVLTIEEPIVLHATIGATTLPAEGDAAIERTVAFDGGLELDVVPDVLNFSGGAYDQLAMAVVPPSSPGVCFLSEGDRPDGLFAFSPEANVEGEGFAVRIPNTFGFAPGQHVALTVLGGLDCVLSDETHLLEGEWREFGRGTVSSDGTVIESDADSGLPCLTWLGVYAIEG